MDPSDDYADQPPHWVPSLGLCLVVGAVVLTFGCGAWFAFFCPSIRLGP